MTGDDETKHLIELIEGVCDGLVYVSETDAPIEPVAFRDADRTARFLGDDVEISNASDFSTASPRRAWHGEAERERARRFARLRKVLEENLTELKVYRVGKIRMNIYVLGKTKSGAVAGVKTRAVET